MSIKIGDHVGKYKIEEELGKGGMATVFKGYHVDLHRYNAIKVLHAELGQDSNSIERFKQEARIIANLKNPHIVHINDYDQHQGQPYFVLDLIDGQTLRQQLANSPLPDDKILDIVFAVGDALNYAHMNGVLHRDIKPSNILIANDGKIYLTDFGLARIAESQSSLTGEMMVGTLQYMSPEQALGSESLDSGTDIYSFGVVMYEMILGRLPYDFTDPMSEIHNFTTVRPILPTTIKSDLGRDVEKVLLKALAKQRQDRYLGVTELITAFMKAWITNTDQKSVSSATLEAFAFSALVSEDGIAFPLVQDKVVLGRNSTTKEIYNDIDLTELDLKKIVSRRHAIVERCEDGYQLADLGSRNGTFLNGERVPPNTLQLLKQGDEIEFGKNGVKFRFAN